MSHLDDDDLEKYHLGMIEDEAELAPFEEHLIACGECASRAEKRLTSLMPYAKKSSWAILIRLATAPERR